MVRSQPTKGPQQKRPPGRINTTYKGRAGWENTAVMDQLGTDTAGRESRRQWGQKKSRLDGARPVYQLRNLSIRHKGHWRILSRMRPDQICVLENRFGNNIGFLNFSSSTNVLTKHLTKHLTKSLKKKKFWEYYTNWGHQHTYLWWGVSVRATDRDLSDKTLNIKEMENRVSPSSHKKGYKLGTFSPQV